MKYTHIVLWPDTGSGPYTFVAAAPEETEVVEVEGNRLEEMVKFGLSYLENLDYAGFEEDSIALREMLNDGFVSFLEAKANPDCANSCADLVYEEVVKWIPELKEDSSLQNIRDGSKWEV